MTKFIETRLVYIALKAGLESQVGHASILRAVVTPC